MIKNFLKNICIYSWYGLILTNYFFLDVDPAQAETTEERVHRIYKNYYQKPILDSDWFKIIEGVEEQSYSVRAGDTLWGISEIYFGDGNYWSKLWSVNKTITNPHLIFVGDTIWFKAGSFETPPGIKVEKGEGETEEKTEATIEVTTNPIGVGKYYSKLPDFFKEQPEYKSKPKSDVIVMPRPTIQYKNDFYLTEEIFDKPPQFIGMVKSIGKDRMLSGEGNVIMIESKETTLAPDSHMSVVREDLDNISEGFGIKVLAIVKVIKNVEGNVYEAEVVKQFDAINLGAALITYTPRHVNMNIASSPTQVPVQIISKDKDIWTVGDMVFLKGEKASLNEGDVLKIFNRYDTKIDFYQHNGLIKVVSVHPPFATAVVVHSKTAIDKNSASEPVKTETGLF